MEYLNNDTTITRIGAWTPEQGWENMQIGLVENTCYGNNSDTRYYPQVFALEVATLSHVDPEPILIVAGSFGLEKEPYCNEDWENCVDDSYTSPSVRYTCDSTLGNIMGWKPDEEESINDDNGDWLSIAGGRDNAVYDITIFDAGSGLGPEVFVAMNNGVEKIKDRGAGWDTIDTNIIPTGSGTPFGYAYTLTKFPETLLGNSSVLDALFVGGQFQLIGHLHTRMIAIHQADVDFDGRGEWLPQGQQGYPVANPASLGVLANTQILSLEGSTTETEGGGIFLGGDFDVVGGQPMHKIANFGWRPDAPVPAWTARPLLHDLDSVDGDYGNGRITSVSKLHSMQIMNNGDLLIAGDGLIIDHPTDDPKTIALFSYDEFADPKRWKWQPDIGSLNGDLYDGMAIVPDMSYPDSYIIGSKFRSVDDDTGSEIAFTKKIVRGVYQDNQWDFIAVEKDMDFLLDGSHFIADVKIHSAGEYIYAAGNLPNTGIKVDIPDKPELKHFAYYDGDYWTSFGLTLATSTRAVEINEIDVGEVDIYVGGNFGSVTIDAVPNSGIKRLIWYDADAVGTKWKALPGVWFEEGTIYDLEIEGDYLYIAGSFEYMDANDNDTEDDTESNYGYLFRYSLLNNTPEALDLGLDGTVRDIEFYDDGINGKHLYIGGEFLSASGTDSYAIGRWTHLD
jgi:hypothetical protein